MVDKKIELSESEFIKLLTNILHKQKQLLGKMKQMEEILNNKEGLDEKKTY